MTDQEHRDGERIAKLLARAGIASRREVERMIEAGRVKLGEAVIITPNTVLPSLRGVTVDGKAVKAAEPTRLFAFHKPDGLLTAERDPAGRATIYTALRNALPKGTPRMMPVGRLDFKTEGLLLLTNDGELKRAMELPATGLPRTYRARTFGDITQNQLEDLIEGITIDGVRYDQVDANMERRTGRNQWIEVTISEGKNREVRRVLEHLGLEVSRLIRTAYGPFQLGDLPRGAAFEIRQVDVERFRKALKVGENIKPISPAPRPPVQEPEQPRRAHRPPAPRKPGPGPERILSDKPRRARPSASGSDGKPTDEPFRPRSPTTGPGGKPTGRSGKPSGPRRPKP